MFAHDDGRAAEVNLPTVATYRRHGCQAEANRHQTIRCTNKKLLAHFVLPV